MMTEQERAASALSHLDAGCSREDWIKAGMAAKAAGLSFDEFHKWSALGGNYAWESDCLAVWKSFKEGGGITANSLFSMANAEGWKDPSKYQKAVNGNGTCIPIAALKKKPTRLIKPNSNSSPIEVWGRCVAATNQHAYILDKTAAGVPLDALRVVPPNDPLRIAGESMVGALVVPVTKADGSLSTLQFIASPDLASRLKAAGQPNKMNLPHYPVEGWHIVGDLADSPQAFIVEGIGQAWAVWKATGCAAVVSFGVSRMATVADALREKHPSARLVVLPDRGQERKAEEIAHAINGEWCEFPVDKPSNYDANDLMQESGIGALGDLLKRTKAPPLRFNLLSGTELCNAPPMRWIVRGVLPSEGLAALYGPSGSGKSFLTLDIAASIAGGAYNWFGRRVTQCPVTYVCLEGEQGMGKRVKAWNLHHRKPIPDSLRFLTKAFDLLNGDDVAELSKAIRAAGGGGGLVILDTLNRAAPGADENSSVDMGNIIAAAKRLQSLIDGLVLLVHHTGKDAARGLRGHSSLYAALDGAIEVTKTDARREWSVAKSKDDETGTVHAFRLDVVQVGFDDEGEEVTSCVAVPDDTIEAVKQVKLPSGGNQKIALGALAEPLRTSKEFNKDGAPNGHPCIRLDEAVSLVAERMVCEGKHKSSRAKEAVTGLVARGIYGVKGDWLWRI